jgi:hypothetical protein
VHSLANPPEIGCKRAYWLGGDHASKIETKFLRFASQKIR